MHQIANDGSQKISQRWVPSVLAQRQAGASVEHLAFATAAWCRFLRGVDETGGSYTINDPMAAELQERARRHAGDAAATAAALLGLTAIWGQTLASDGSWRQRVAHWLAHIDGSGVRAAMARLQTGNNA